MKIIFLDIDGVLNCKYTKEEIFFYTFVSPKKIELLKQLIERTDAQVVLSSTWRHGWADIEAGINDSTDAKCFVALKKELEKYGISFLDYTPITNGAVNRRGEEIDTWLKSWKNEPIDSFVILDDLFISLYSDRLVRTNMKHGLLQEHVDIAVKILDKPWSKGM